MRLTLQEWSHQGITFRRKLITVYARWKEGWSLNGRPADNMTLLNHFSNANMLWPGCFWTQHLFSHCRRPKQELQHTNRAVRHNPVKSRFCVWEHFIHLKSSFVSRVTKSRDKVLSHQVEKIWGTESSVRICLCWWLKCVLWRQRGDWGELRKGPTCHTCGS